VGDFAPPPSQVLSRLTAGKARYAVAQEASRDAHKRAFADHVLPSENARAGRLREVCGVMTCRARLWKPGFARITR